jgi:hypothetical protein
MGHADIRTTQHSLEGQVPACKRLRGPLSCYQESAQRCARFSSCPDVS